MSKVRLLGLCAILIWIASALSTIAHAIVPDGTVPAQFIAKMYTEVLGRAPDPGGWSAYVRYFKRNDCSQVTLKTAGKQFYLSQEYTNLGYDNAEKVLTLYRGILNREPDPGGFASWVNSLNQGNAFSAVVDGFFASSEFAGEVEKICVGDGSRFARSYGWGHTPVLTIPIAGSGFQGDAGGLTSADLQARLDRARPGDTVFLARRSVTRTDVSIVVPAGVTLATTGVSDRGHYARMGRIVRASLFSGPVVWLKPGAMLHSVWVTGQRNVVGFNFNSGSSGNVYVESGENGEVTNNRTDSPAGWSTLYAHGTRETHIACRNLTIAGNLSTGYTSHHTLMKIPGCTGNNCLELMIADGISNACEGATITNNHIVDPTDVGIVLFRADPAVQQSQVTHNVIVSAGLSAYGAMVADPLTNKTDEETVPDFTGALFANNEYWTSDATHFDIGLSAGTMAWFFNVHGAIGSGVSFQNNIARLRPQVNIGILIDGMMNASFVGNAQAFSTMNVDFCPTGAVLADKATTGHASGTLPANAIQAVAHSCNGHTPD